MNTHHPPAGVQSLSNPHHNKSAKAQQQHSSSNNHVGRKNSPSRMMSSPPPLSSSSSSPGASPSSPPALARLADVGGGAAGGGRKRSSSSITSDHHRKHTNKTNKNSVVVFEEEALRPLFHEGSHSHGGEAQTTTTTTTTLSQRRKSFNNGPNGSRTSTSPPPPGSSSSNASAAPASTSGGGGGGPKALVSPPRGPRLVDLSSEKERQPQPPVKAKASPLVEPKMHRPVASASALSTSLASPSSSSSAPSSSSSSSSGSSSSSSLSSSRNENTDNNNNDNNMSSDFGGTRKRKNGPTNNRWTPRPGSTMHPARPLYRWLVLIFACQPIFASYFADQGIGATVPLLKKEFGISTTQIGVLWGVAGWPSLLLSPVAGVMVAKYGTRTTSLVCNVLTFLGSVIFAVAPNFWVMVLGRAIYGLGLDPSYVISDTIIARWFSEGRGRTASPSLPVAYSFLTAIGEFGEVLGLNILPLVALWSLRGTFILGSFTLLLGVLFNLLYNIMDYKAAPVLGLDDDAEAADFSLARVAKFPRIFWLLCLVSFFSYSQVWPVVAFTTDFIHSEYDYSLNEAGHLTSIVFAVPLVLSPLLGFLLQRFVVYTLVLLVGALLLMAGLLMFALGASNPVFPLLVISLSFTLMPCGVWPSIPLVTPPEMTGTAFGILTVTQSLCFIVVPVLIGLFHEHYGSYTYPFLFLAGMACFGFLLSLATFLLDLFSDRSNLFNLHSSSSASSSAYLSSSKRKKNKMRRRLLDGKDYGELEVEEMDYELEEPPAILSEELLEAAEEPPMVMG